MKAVLISIKPQWCEKIASGEKNIEVRKTRPNIDTPFKVYIYCTKDKYKHLVQQPDKSFCIYDGKDYGKYDKHLKFINERNGQIIGEFLCNEIDLIDMQIAACLNDANENMQNIKKNSCLSSDELLTYLSIKNTFVYRNGYGLHISDLKIYDEPKKLSEFEYYDKYECADGESADLECTMWKKRVKKPPQSWCYVNERTREE